MLAVKCKSSRDVAELLGALRSSLFVDWRHNRVYVGTADLANASDPLDFEDRAPARRISATDEVRALCNEKCLTVFQLETQGLLESFVDKSGCLCFEVKK